MMPDQYRLFEQRADDGHPLRYQRHSETSRAAAVKAKSSAATARAMVLRYIRSRGEHGATDPEIQAALPMSGDTERPRRVELEKAGMIRDTGRRRETPSGRPAVVWVGVESGR